MTLRSSSVLEYKYKRVLVNIEELAEKVKKVNWTKEQLVQFQLDAKREWESGSVLGHVLLSKGYLKPSKSFNELKTERLHFVNYAKTQYLLDSSDTVQMRL